MSNNIRIWPKEIVWHSAKVIKPITFLYSNSCMYRDPSIRNTFVWYTKFDDLEVINENTVWFTILRRNMGYCSFDLFTSETGKHYFQSIQKNLLYEPDRYDFEFILKDFYYNRFYPKGYLNTIEAKTSFKREMEKLYGNE